MARKTETLELRGRTFRVTQMGGTRGTRFFYTYCVGVVVPTLAKLGAGLSMLDGVGMNADISELVRLLPDVGTAAETLFAKLPPADFEKLMKEILDGSTVKPLDGGDERELLPIFDDEMAGETSAVFQLLGFALRVNFGNFMPGLVAQAKALQVTKAKSE